MDIIVLMLILPVAETLIGLIFYKSEIPMNSLLGYRTPGSQTSRETWDFAQKYCGKICMIAGGLLIALIAVFLLVISPAFSLSTQQISRWTTEIICVEAIIMFLPTIVLVEHAIKTKFDDRGHYKKREKNDK